MRERLIRGAFRIRKDSKTRNAVELAKNRKACTINMNGSSSLQHFDDVPTSSLSRIHFIDKVKQTKTTALGDQKS